MQQPPRGGTWVGNTCVTSKSYEIQVLPSEWLHISTFFQGLFHRIQTKFRNSRVGPMGRAHGRGLLCGSLSFNANTGKIERTFAPVSAGTGVVFPGAIKSPTIMDFKELRNFYTCEEFHNLSPRVDLEIFTDVIRVSINEQLIQIYNSLFDFRLKCDLCVGLRPVSLEIFTDDIRLLVQLCFELRGVDLEIFADDIRLCFELRGVDLEIFADDIRVNINEQLIQIYNSLFDFRLKCDVGLCVGLRPVSLEIFTDDIRLLVQLCGELRRVNLEIFTGARNFDNLSPRVDLEIFEHLRDFENLSPPVDLEIFESLRDFENLSPPVDLEIFTPLRNFENLSPRVDSEIFEHLRDFENPTRRVDLEIFTPLRNFENLSPRVDLEIFAPLMNFENLSLRVDLEIFESLRDFENLTRRVDLEIFTPLRNFENLSSRVDLEIFEHLRDFENISPPMDLEIFAPLVDFENLSLRFRQNTSRMALSHILILPCCHSKCSYIVVIIESTLTRGSPNTATFTWWDLGRHDRSCLDMSEADGVDSGAICKRGFIHLQFAAKPEAPEAERHLGSRILE
ncbi:uncharacterized protein V1477_011779 [Vespula maculifrons]|uniref:Uncharacterized protein n=1 Tax=Vespula maculifrons TaxID=7453 RepID=A0ABD2C088_VESMC